MCNVVADGSRIVDANSQHIACVAALGNIRTRNEGKAARSSPHRRVVPFHKKNTEAFDELRPKRITSMRPGVRIANLFFQTGRRTIQPNRQALLAIIRMTK